MILPHTIQALDIHGVLSLAPLKGVIMDLGLGSLVKEFEDRLGRRPVTVLLVLTYVLVLSWFVQTILSVWVWIGELIEQDGPIGIMAQVGSSVFIVVATLLALRELVNRHLRRFKKEAEKIVDGRENPPSDT